MDIETWRKQYKQREELKENIIVGFIISLLFVIIGYISMYLGL